MTGKLRPSALEAFPWLYPNMGFLHTTTGTGFHLRIWVLGLLCELELTSSSHHLPLVATILSHKLSNRVCTFLVILFFSENKMLTLHTVEGNVAAAASCRQRWGSSENHTLVSKGRYMQKQMHPIGHNFAAVKCARFFAVLCS